MSTTRLAGPERREQLMSVARTVLAERGFHDAALRLLTALDLDYWK